MSESTDYSEIRFGAVAVQEGFITEDQLIKALKAQVKDDLKGRPHRLLGEVLQQQGVMTWSQIGEVLICLGAIEQPLEP